MEIQSQLESNMVQKFGTLFPYSNVKAINMDGYSNCDLFDSYSILENFWSNIFSLLLLIIIQFNNTLISEPNLL